MTHASTGTSYNDTTDRCDAAVVALVRLLGRQAAQELAGASDAITKQANDTEED
ncbi:hypothetical protein ACFORG_12270 [Lutimaribacter marinistellae]|uniref:Uncharacterized protein n=1 Tax=Lutimaribacter marinistellae TaxID=1820329 RepID=A0ABV7TI02_9RHOB